MHDVHRRSVPRRSVTMAGALAFAVALAAHHPGARAQQVDGATRPAEPPSAVERAERRLKLEHSVATPDVLRITLPPADVESERRATTGGPNQPVQVGFHRPVPGAFQGDLASLIDWVPLGDGAVVGTLSVTSPEASAIRVGLSAAMVAGGEIRFFGDTGGEATTGLDSANGGLPVVTSESFHVEGGVPRLLWSPIVEGDTVGIEISLPSPDALSAFSFRIEKVSHIFDLTGTWGVAPKLECANHVDVQCRAGRFPRDKESGVARIFYERFDGSFICSGTLVQDGVDATFVPYFMTASHCVSTAAEARSVNALWFYQRASCGSGAIDPRMAWTRDGADLLATSVAQDSTLLRLNSLPAGRTLHFSGWSADPLHHPVAVYGLHYPGDRSDRYNGVMKYAEGTTLGQAPIQVDDFIVQNAIGIQWSDGLTEGGSSGSGLFHGDNLIGVLSGGIPGCGGRGDVYGPFRDFYPQVARWLNPAPAETTHTIALVTEASFPNLGSFVRLVNRSDRGGTVSIRGIDDTGRRFGPASLSLNANETKQLNATDLENGNSALGLASGLGDGTGHWRIQLTTELDLEALAYIRTHTGFVTSLHDVAAETRDGSQWRYHVPFFNPGSNDRQVSRMRLVNPGTGDATVEITGVDDDGRGASGGSVRLTLRNDTAVLLSAEQLENGDPGQGLSGGLGDGTGKWRLSVLADRRILVMNLLFSQITGNLANLSSGQAGTPGGGPPWPGADAPDLATGGFSAAPTTVTAGQPIGMAVSITNQGRAQSDSTTVRYYRSSDATITASDVEVGMQAVTPLAPSEIAFSSVAVRAPASAGTYHYGACVDAVTNESDTSNNCSASVAVTVPGGGQPGVTLWGAIAAGMASADCSGRFGWNWARNRPTESEATDAVLNGCRSRGLLECRAQAFTQCGALARGLRVDGCYLTFGTGESSFAAANSALANCRNAGYICYVPVGDTSGLPAVYCNRGYSSGPASLAGTPSAVSP